MGRNMFKRLWSTQLRLWSEKKPIKDEVLYVVASQIASIAMTHNNAIREAAAECGVKIDFIDIKPLEDGFEKGHRYSYVTLIMGYSEEDRDQSKDFSLDWLFNTVLEKYCVSDELEMYVQGM